MDTIDFPAAIGYFIGIAGALTIIFSRVKNSNLADLKDRVDILEKEREEARKQHLENQRAIAHLEGQLSTYKEIPLKSIAGSLEKLTESNDLIVQTLQGSAKITLDEKKAGGLLVKTNKVPLAVKVNK